MKFEIKNSGGNLLNLLRRAGYFAHHDSFVRPIERSGYPRFHIYVEQKDDVLIFNLHLDQKRPVYKGAAAHSGEYDSSIVEQEAQRIKELLI